MKVKHLKISHTSLTSFRQSPRQFWYSYVLGLRPRASQDSRALVFGQAVHRAMELSIRQGAIGPDIATTIRAEFAPDVAEQALETARQFLLVQEIRPEQVLATELEIEIPLTDRISYLGHLDLLYRQADGSVAVLDYKTTSKHLTLGWQPSLLPAQQGIGYVAAAQHAGHDCDLIVFQGISSDAKLLDPDYVPRPRSGAPGQRPPQFLRVPFYVEPYHIATWKAGVLADAGRMLAMIEAGPQDAHCTCTSGLTWCPFRQLCMAPPGTQPSPLDFDQSDFRGFVLDIEPKA